jgi:hypothetical protein
MAGKTRTGVQKFILKPLVILGRIHYTTEQRQDEHGLTIVMA